MKAEISGFSPISLVHFEQCLNSPTSPISTQFSFSFPPIINIYLIVDSNHSPRVYNFFGSLRNWKVIFWVFAPILLVNFKHCSKYLSVPIFHLTSSEILSGTSSLVDCWNFNDIHYRKYLVHPGTIYPQGVQDICGSECHWNVRFFCACFSHKFWTLLELYLLDCFRLNLLWNYFW